MNLGKWVTAQSTARGTNRRAILEDLTAKSGVAFVTIESAARGARIGLYKKALAISVATDWAVNVVELCDENPEETIGRIVAGASHAGA